MTLEIKSRLKRSVNAFFNRDPTYSNVGRGYTYRPDRVRFTKVTNDPSLRQYITV